MGLFENPIWTFAFALATAVVGVASLVVMWPKRPQIIYELVDYEVAPKQRRRDDGLPGDSRVVVRVWNAGSANITPDDYVHPIAIYFQYFHRTRIYSARIIASSPNDIKELESLAITSRQFTDNEASLDTPLILGSYRYEQLIFPRMLLHPHDSVTFEAWISPPSALTSMYRSLFGIQPNPTIGVLGRVVNVKEFRRYEKGSRQARLWCGAAIAIVAAILVAALTWFLPYSYRAPDALVGIFAACALCLLAVRWKLVRDLYFVWPFVLALMWLYVLSARERLRHDAHNSSQ